MWIHQRFAAGKAPGEDAELGRLVHPREDALANGAILWLLVLPDGAVAALHIAMQRRFKHHHEGTVETVPQLSQRVFGHQSFFQRSLISWSTAIFRPCLERKSLVAEFLIDAHLSEAMAFQQCVRGVVKLQLDRQFQFSINPDYGFARRG